MAFCLSWSLIDAPISLSSLETPTKLVLWSLQMMDGFPLLMIKRRKHSVAIDAVVVKQILAPNVLLNHETYEDGNVSFKKVGYTSQISLYQNGPGVVHAHTIKT